MNPYTLIASGLGTPEARELSRRLTDWHDTMVAHERQLRAGRVGVCDEDCPHGEAHMLWAEAVATFGPRAYQLAFLRTRAGGAHRTSEDAAMPVDASHEHGHVRRQTGDRMNDKVASPLSL